MPTYQYKCTDCNIQTDVIRGITDNAPDPFCTKCNSAMKRSYSSSIFGVQFNGSGFYSKDK